LSNPFCSRLALRIILLLSTVLLGSVDFVRAQRVSPYFGVGGARDSAGTTANNSANTCPTGQLFDGLICENGPKMSGLFGQVGVDFMFRTHFGVNAEYAFKFSRADFLPADSLRFRPSFYDLNVLWQPFASKRVIPFLEGGVGAAKISLYSTGTPITGVTNLSSFPAGSDTNHLQLHFAAGVKFYIRGKIFVRPTFDLHYARNLTDQFKSNQVIGYMISAGYTFGGR
jgi:hypothetical protein